MLDFYELFAIRFLANNTVPCWSCKIRKLERFRFFLASLFQFWRPKRLVSSFSKEHWSLIQFTVQTKFKVILFWNDRRKDPQKEESDSFGQHFKEEYNTTNQRKYIAFRRRNWGIYHMWTVSFIFTHKKIFLGTDQRVNFSSNAWKFAQHSQNVTRRCWYQQIQQSTCQPCSFDLFINANRLGLMLCWLVVSLVRNSFSRCLYK